jgi:hypothetical protein
MASIREQLEREPKAIEEAAAMHRFLESLDPGKWNALLHALATNDKESVAKVFGTTIEKMEQEFKALKLRAKELTEKHPALAKGGKV